MENICPRESTSASTEEALAIRRVDSGISESIDEYLTKSPVNACTQILDCHKTKAIDPKGNNHMRPRNDSSTSTESSSGLLDQKMLSEEDVDGSWLYGSSSASQDLSSISEVDSWLREDLESASPQVKAATKSFVSRLKEVEVFGTTSDTSSLHQSLMFYPPEFPSFLETQTKGVLPIVRNDEIKEPSSLSGAFDQLDIRGENNNNCDEEEQEEVVRHSNDEGISSVVFDDPPPPPPPFSKKEPQITLEPDLPKKAFSDVTDIEVLALMQEEALRKHISPRRPPPQTLTVEPPTPNDGHDGKSGEKKTKICQSLSCSASNIYGDLSSQSSLFPISKSHEQIFQDPQNCKKTQIRKISLDHQPVTKPKLLLFNPQSRNGSGGRRLSCGKGNEEMGGVPSTSTPKVKNGLIKSPISSSAGNLRLLPKNTQTSSSQGSVDSVGGGGGGSSGSSESSLHSRSHQQQHTSHSRRSFLPRPVQGSASSRIPRPSGIPVNKSVPAGLHNFRGSPGKSTTGSSSRTSYTSAYKR